MDTSISIPDQVFEQADRLAKRLDLTPSQLVTEALMDYITRHETASVTDRLNEVLDSISEPEDRFVTETARSVLRRVEW